MPHFCHAESQEGTTLPACGMSTIGVMAAGNRGPGRRLCELASRRSAESRGVAVSATGARCRRNHIATANEYCPSSSTVVRHFTMRYRRRTPPILPLLRSVSNRSAFQQAEPRTQEILLGGDRLQRDRCPWNGFAFRAAQSIQPMASMLKLPNPLWSSCTKLLTSWPCGRMRGSCCSAWTNWLKK